MPRKLETEQSTYRRNDVAEAIKGAEDWVRQGVRRQLNLSAVSFQSDGRGCGGRTTRFRRKCHDVPCHSSAADMVGGIEHGQVWEEVSLSNVSGRGTQTQFANSTYGCALVDRTQPQVE